MKQFNPIHTLTTHSKRLILTLSYLQYLGLPTSLLPEIYDRKVLLIFPPEIYVSAYFIQHSK